MKNFIFFLACFSLLFGCKNNTQTEAPQTQVETDTIPLKNYALSLAQWSLNKPIFAGTADPMDFAKTASELGFSGLEYVSQLYVNEAVNYPMKQQPLQTILDTLKARSEQYGMNNLIIMIDGEGDLSFNDTALTKQAIENHKKWIDAAAFLGCHSIRINLFGEENEEDWKRNSIAALSALCDYAAPKNVNIIVENHGGLSSNAALLASVMEAVNKPNCGTLPDFGNFCLKREGGARWAAPCVEEYDMYKGIEELMPWAKGVSAKSYAFDAEGNETKIDYYKMIDIVKHTDFEGYIGVEFEGPEENPTPGILATKKLLEKGLNITQ